MAEAIAQAIREGQLRSGSRLMPLRQLAERYGISFETARLALGQLERQGLVSRRHGSGTFVTYEPKPAVASLGIATCLWLNFHEHVYQNLADELLGILQQENCYAITTAVWRQGSGLEQLDSLTRTWSVHPPRYLVLQWEKPGLDEAIVQRLPTGTRVIAPFRHPQLLPAGWHSVNTDRYEMARLATNHVLERGHSRIGFIEPKRLVLPQWKSSLHKATEPHTPWLLAVGQTLRQTGLRVQVRHLEREVQSAPGEPFPFPRADPMSPTNQQTIRQWLGSADRPTAIIGMDYYLAAVQLVARQLALRVPEDLTLVGLGNTPWSDAGGFPSVAYNEQQVARQVVNLIRASDEELAETTCHRVVPPKLIMR